uniref:Uncharacterized protein n=1 Tax=Panagrolaimus sp. JU765 TaxID=591449 RepID=A0AC34QHM3_9BILA
MATDDLKALLASFDDDEAEERSEDDFCGGKPDHNLTDATEWSYVTANDTFTEKPNRTILNQDDDVFNWSDDDDLDKTPGDPKPEVRTPEAVKALLRAERSIKKESESTPKASVDNSSVFLGGLNSKTEKIKNALAEKEQYPVFDVAFGIRVK